VVGITPSRSRPNRGMIALRSETRNQRGDVVQVLTAKLVVPRHAPTAS
jgi:acyl dehydratase